MKQTEWVAEYLANWLIKQNIRLNYTLNELDFVLDNSEVFNSNSLFETEYLKQFDYIISNPPYYKYLKRINEPLLQKN